jgi:organic radical activating enzyme
MISIETDGYTRPCCGENSIQSQISHISNGILNSFNDKKIIFLRDELKKGFSKNTMPFCFRCENLESRNQKSLRTKTKFLSSNRELKLIQFKMSNKCQLACFHCGPSQSSTWAKKLNLSSKINKGFKITDEFLNELSTILPNLSVIKFTGGEPFLDFNHWKILEYLKKFDRSHCELHYITNGISNFKPVLWEGWKTIKCSVSIDGFEESYEWFRRGSTWDKILVGVQNLNDFSEVEINYSLTPFTIQDFLKAKNFWKYKFTAIPIVYPSYANLVNFPEKIIHTIDNFQSIPFSAYSKTDDVKNYVTWANKWDSMWATPGWADKIFWWVKEFNDANKTNF